MVTIGNIPKRKWQNLLHKKCPNCDSRLNERKGYLICPNAHPTEPQRNCFFIKNTTAIEFLINPEHPAHFCLSPHEKEKIDEAVKALTNMTD